MLKRKDRKLRRKDRNLRTKDDCELDKRENRSAEGRPGPCGMSRAIPRRSEAPGHLPEVQTRMGILSRDCFFFFRFLELGGFQAAPGGLQKVGRLHAGCHERSRGDPRLLDISRESKRGREL